MVYDEKVFATWRDQLAREQRHVGRLQEFGEREVSSATVALGKIVALDRWMSVTDGLDAGERAPINRAGLAPYHDGATIQDPAEAKLDRRIARHPPGVAETSDRQRIGIALHEPFEHARSIPRRDRPTHNAVRAHIDLGERRHPR